MKASPEAVQARGDTGRAARQLLQAPFEGFGEEGGGGFMPLP